MRDVTWQRFIALFKTNWISWFKKMSIWHHRTNKAIPQQQTFLIIGPHHITAKTSWHRHGTILQNCHPTYIWYSKTVPASQTDSSSLVGTRRSCSEQPASATFSQSINLLLLLHRFNGLFSRTTCVSRYQKSKTGLDLNEARDDGVLGCGGISWTICNWAAPRSRQITTPTPHDSNYQ